VLCSGGNRQTSLGFGKRVLVVDDEESVRSIIAMLLEALGAVVIAVNSGSRALELYRQEAFDLVLTDYNMPQMRGDELARTIKAVNPEQRVVLITGYAGGLCEEGSTPAGFDGLILKPCTLDQLAHALSDIPQQKSAAPSQNYLAA
jgi:CheY-like chemotaxis protein